MTAPGTYNGAIVSFPEPATPSGDRIHSPDSRSLAMSTASKRLPVGLGNSGLGGAGLDGSGLGGSDFGGSGVGLGLGG